MQPYDDRNVLSLTWLARPVGGEERAGDDLTELRWFGPDELPGADELAFETYVEILSLWRARQQQRVARPARSGTEAAFRAPSALRRPRP